MSEPSKFPSNDVGALLMAMVDGEANAADEWRVRAAMAADPGLAAQADAYQMTGRTLGALFDGKLMEPVPGQLVHTVMTAGTRPRDRAPLAAAGQPSWRLWLGSWQLPLAAGAVAVAAGWLMMFGAAGPAATQLASTGLSQALSAAISGAQHDIMTSEGKLAFRLVETFRDHGGAVCREYEAQGSTGSRQYGVACRDAGAWRIKALLLGEAMAAGQTKSAGAGDLSDKLDAVVEKMIAGDALGVEDERKLIAESWQADK